MLSKMRKKRSQRGEPLAGRQLRDGRWEALTCSIAGAGPGWTVRRASACRNWGGVGGEARRWVSGWYCPTWGTFRQDPGSPPHPFAGLASPRAHPALPAAIVQVEQESVVPKFLKGLVVVPVHVACGGAINLPSGGGSGGGSRDTEHPPGARPKPRGWGKGLGPPVRCPFGGHGRGGGDPNGAPGASRPLLIPAAPWRDNSGKWSRSNGKGTAGRPGTRRWEALQVRYDGGGGRTAWGGRSSPRDGRSGMGPGKHHHWPRLPRSCMWELAGKRFPCPGCSAGISSMAPLVLRLLPGMHPNGTALCSRFWVRAQLSAARAMIWPTNLAGRRTTGHGAVWVSRSRGTLPRPPAPARRGSPMRKSRTAMSMRSRRRWPLS